MIRNIFGFKGDSYICIPLLYNKVRKRKEWLESKAWFFISCKYGYAGDGRWNYVLDRKGNVLEGTISIFSDFHVLQGVAEYLKIEEVRTPENMELLKTCYETMEKNVFDPWFKEIYENTWSPVFIWHDMYLTCLSTTETCAEVLGTDVTKKLLNECVDKIANWFANDEYNVVFEAVTRENKIDIESDKGRFINPGHMHESAWFLMKAGVLLEDKQITMRGIQIARWANAVGKDEEYGGIISYADALGKHLARSTGLKKRTLYGMKKYGGPNAEALTAYAQAYCYTKDSYFLQEFLGSA